MKKLFILISLCVMTISGFATTPPPASGKQFTLEDLNFGGTNYHSMVPENRWTTWWGDNLVRLDADKCYLVDKNTGKETLLLDIDDFKKINYNVNSLMSATFPEAGKPIVIVRMGKQFMAYNWQTKRNLWTLNIESGTQASKLCYASKSLAFVKDDQLFVEHIKENDNNRTRVTNAITNDGSRNIVYGQSVHRDEFGIREGLFWSPDGQRLAFYRMDQSMVTDFPMIDIPDPNVEPKSGSRIATAAPEKYPMAGETSHKVTVGVYDLNTEKVVYLKAGDPTDRYFTNIAWSPDSKTIYMFELNRDQNDCRLVSYDAATGDKLKELYCETDSKYVEPQNPIMFLPWDDSKFIMQSQKDGYNHFYLFDTNGKQLKQITSGKWVVMDFLGFNKKHHSIVYASNEVHPTQRNLWIVDIETGKRTLMDDNGKGWHNGSVSSSGQFIYDNYQEPAVPRKIAIVNTENGKRVPYFTAADPWKGYNVPEYRMGSIKAADGITDLYYRMVMPVGFDPAKKYPTIIYVYGGPHAHNVDARWHWSSRGWETYMAQKGYLLFILDNRGSENRGKDFEQATFRHLGDREVEDQMKGVEYLKSLSYVDGDRMGVHGWSFGGFMTINMMTTHPEVFKVGVSGGPVIDWKWYEVMYGERYMDTPQTNPDGFHQSSLIPKAKNLKGKLQIIIGLNDVTCVPQHSFSFLKQCIQDGVQCDYFVYPGEPHNMRGHQSVHLHERISQYFDDWLK